MRRAVCAAALIGATGAGPMAGAQTQGGTLHAVAQPEPPVVMIAVNQQTSTTYVASKMFESLLTYSFDLKPVPSLAKSWKISDDGLVYTFYLQPGVKWHDGKPFTADDVVFSVDKFLRKVHPRSRGVINTFIESITAIDDLTVEFKLKQPFSPFLAMFTNDSMPIVPKHLYDGTDYLSNPANQAPVGTGPFKFQEWKKGSHIVLVRNPDYWRKGQPYLDKIVFHVIPDAASRAVAFENNVVQVMRSLDVDNVDVKRLGAMPGVDSSSQGWEMLSPQAFMVMNQRKPPFDNVKVRQAVMHAINRDFIVKNIFFGLARVATGPVSSTTPFYDKDVPAFDYNPEKAKALIEESGVDVAATPIKLLASGSTYGSAWDRLDEYLRQSLEQVGFEVEIDPVDNAGWVQHLSNFDFDLALNWTAQYGDPGLGVSRLFLSSNIVKGSPFVNNEGYRNPRVDELLNQAAAEVSPAARQKLYSEAQKILVSDVALGYLFEFRNLTFYRSNIKNLVTTGIGLNESFADVSIEK
ncbi:ABC transporter substrate-binding protein [Bordetella sp. BOR01]|uniref:ABC transporter substrate-binding protein n=1 Tax=Bordetella sp. BOR01 TaxID=2854779 RepID=UPI002105697E|nr:ABC transporter substrate-binding protein [Bordetella sp. BOR01]